MYDFSQNGQKANEYDKEMPQLLTTDQPGLEVIKREFILRLKIKCNDWLIADTCPQSANHCALF